jgi:D-3-phosphoglycerate dehydrogenase
MTRRPDVVRVGAFPHRVPETVAWEREAFADRGYDFEFLEPGEAAAGHETLRQARAVICGGLTWDRQMVERLESCEILVACSVGLDWLDVESATECGIAVCNLPEFCTDEVADHTIALLLACVRKISRLDRRVRSGTWDRAILEPMPRLRGKTLGLVGLGRIARAVAERTSSFGMTSVAYDPYVDAAAAKQAGVELLDLTELCGRADVVSCHVPLLASTSRLIGEAQFRAMKPSAYFVNTSRGGVVDEAALVRALEGGWIRGAGLDVLQHEPPEPDNPLLSLENVVLTPHMASFSDEVIDEIPRLAVAAALAVLEGGTPPEIGWVNRAALDGRVPRAPR